MKKVHTAPDTSKKDDLLKAVKAFKEAHPDLTFAADYTWLSQITTYSIDNIVMILTQCDMRGINPVTLEGFKGYAGWQLVGRQVRKGEKGYAILAPITRKVEDSTSGEEIAHIVACKITYVFDLSQTDEIKAEGEGE